MTSSAPSPGVMLLTYGGPRSPEEIDPFLTKISGGRPLPPPARAAYARRYAAIGGRSPLPAIVDALADRLRERLATAKQPRPVEVGTLFARPSVAEAVAKLAAAGVGRCTAIVLVPQYSAATVGRYLRRLDEEMEAAGRPFHLLAVRTWARHPLLARAFADKMAEALAPLPEPERAATTAVFTAHSVPFSMLPMGDPFEAELRATAAAAAELAGIARWGLAFQSAAGERHNWYGPRLEAAIDDLARAGARRALVVPIHFLVDNVEILFDIDIELAERARARGLEVLRAPSLNTSPLLVEALAALAENPDITDAAEG